MSGPLRPKHHAPPPLPASSPSPSAPCPAPPLAPRPHSPQPQPPPPMPHHHNAWNHLQIPNYFPRQPQVAHMSSDRSSLTWHTPTPSEHQQNLKSAPNSFRHTPTPPDIQLLKGASNPLFRHTPTPPDRDSLKMFRLTPTPPDGQSVKSSSNPLFRHTPTPPDIAHSMKGTGPLYRHTPPPDGLKGPSNPLFNLQQMMSGNVHPNEPLRDNFRGDNLGFSRHSPGLVLGSMDLSVTRSPRNGSQNGETGLPMSLSVRDATKINSLDSAEITKIHQVPSSFSISKAIELSKSSSPTPSSMSQSSNSPKSPKQTNKRPVKKVDSILERLNSGSDGVVIMPVQHNPSLHSVIVSAHSLEDSNSRGSSSSCNITPVISGSNYGSCEITGVDKGTSIIKTSYPLPNSENSQYADSSYLNKETHLLESHSVIKESISANKDEVPTTNFSNEDSNGSSSDSSRSRRRRKQLKTTKVESEQAFVNNVSENVMLPDVPRNANEKLNESKTSTESHAATDLCRLPVPNSIESSTIIQKVSDQNPNKTVENRLAHDTSQINCENSTVPIVSKTRRKSYSESETIDNIAAMIASTDSDSLVKDCSDTENTSENFKPNVDALIDNLDQVLGSPTPEVKNTSEDSQMQQTNNNVQTDLSVDVKPPDTEINKLNDSNKADNNTVVPDKKTSFVEVESELEKMFAGIEEDGKTLSDGGNPSIETSSNAPTIVNTKASKKKGVRKSTDGVPTGLVSSDECSPKKKQKPGKRKATSDSNRSNKKKSKLNLTNKKIDKKPDPLPTKDAYDSGSNASSSKSRGPYVQIKGPRDSPLSVSVINTPIQEDDVDKPLQKIRNLKSKPSLNTDINFRNKVKSRGLHTSTLSMKYDATTTDTSWICVFCKRGPHTRGSSGNTVIQGKSQHVGDLFGPYLVTMDCPDYLSMMNDPHDTLFKGKLNRHESFIENKQSQRGKKIKLDSDANNDVKSGFPNEEMYLGMTEAGTNSFEIWLHEDCAVWAPGLYLVGPKIVGLDAAVWSCCTMRCSLCNLLGATVACIKRGCQKTMHVSCARSDLWSLSEDDFMVYCKDHKTP